jgi:uncharacterized SAM-binding protein YcdF (DUF218 family)
MIGADGWFTLALANGLLLASGGLTLAWTLIEVYRVARRIPATLPDGEWPARLTMVLGFRLGRGRVLPEFAARLNRAATLFRAAPSRPILVVGGVSDGSTLSEAEAGRRRLTALGIPDNRIVKEETSRHTLENLRQARATMACLTAAPFILVTSRYHLARSLALARGLGMLPIACAAEDRLPHDLRTLVRLVREAYFLHWYRVGHAWARWTDNRRSLARIT